MATYIFPDIPSTFKANDQIIFDYTNSVQVLDLTKTFIKKCRIECWGGWGTGSLSYGRHSDYVYGEYDLSKISEKKLYFVVGRAAKGAILIRKYDDWWQYLPHRIDNGDFVNRTVQSMMGNPPSISEKAAECFGGGGVRSGGSSFVTTAYNANEASPGGRTSSIDKGTLGSTSLNSIFICSRGAQNPPYGPKNMVGSSAANTQIQALKSGIIEPGQTGFRHNFNANGLISLVILEDTLGATPHSVKYSINGKIGSAPLFTADNMAPPKGSVVCSINGEKFFAVMTDDLKDTSATKVNAKSNKQRKALLSQKVSGDTGMVSDMTDQTPCPTGSLELLERDITRIPKGVEVVDWYFCTEDGVDRRYDEHTFAVVPGMFVQNYACTGDNTEYTWDHGNARRLNGIQVGTGRWAENGGFWRKMRFKYSPTINTKKWSNLLFPVWGIDRPPLIKMTGTKSGIMDTNLRASMWEPESPVTVTIKMGTRTWTHTMNKDNMYGYMRVYAAGYTHLLVYRNGECIGDDCVDGNIPITFSWT